MRPPGHLSIMDAMSTKTRQTTVKSAPFGAHPVGNTGITNGITPPDRIGETPRLRANLDLSPAVLLCLDHVCEVTGSTRTQVINAALLDALPGLIERADTLVKRHQSLIQSKAARK